ncbi:MAG: ABC transporter ATP-binding protein [Kineosporiaceae bacterium]
MQSTSTAPGRTTPGPVLAGPAAGEAARVEALTKDYGGGATAVHALAGIDLTIRRHRFTAIMGQSGSGKSTLLHCLAGLDRPTSGRVLLGGTDLGSLSDVALTRLRRDRVGFVFQAYNLVPVLTAEENIRLPLRLAGHEVARERFDAVVTALGLADRLGHRPHELSGGQQQRVAVARAVLPAPDLIVADEPTGNLDTRSGIEVLDLLRGAVDEDGQTVVMVTHDAGAAARADRVVLLADGRVAGELADPAGLGVGTILDAVTDVAQGRGL